MSDEEAFELEKRVMLKAPGDMDVLRYVSHCRELRDIARAAGRVRDADRAAQAAHRGGGDVGPPAQVFDLEMVALRSALKAGGR